MVGASTNAVNYPIGLTKPSLGAVISVRQATEAAFSTFAHASTHPGGSQDGARQRVGDVRGRRKWADAGRGRRSSSSSRSEREPNPARSRYPEYTPDDLVALAFPGQVFKHTRRDIRLRAVAALQRLETAGVVVERMGMTLHPTFRPMPPDPAARRGLAAGELRIEGRRVLPG